MPSESKTSKRRLITAEREVKAFELRKGGWTFREIGAELGISGPAAFKLVTKVRRRHADLLKEDVPTQLEMELDRLDAIWRRVWQGVQAGDLPAIDRALKVHMCRTRLLLGLDRKPNGEDDPAGEKRKDSPPLTVQVYPDCNDPANEDSE